MTMKHTSIRWNEAALRVIQEEAEHDGLTTSEFIRQAALAWAFYRRGQRGAEDHSLEAMREFLREQS
jgi:hypothetical protein